MKNRTLMLMIAMFIVAIALVPLPVVAAETPEGKDPNKWQFEFTPYLFAAGLSGKTGINGLTADVDLSFNDILKNLDSGFMAVLEARKGPWMVGFEGVYFRLKDEMAKSWQPPVGKPKTGTLDVTVTEQLYQLSAGYRVSDDSVKVDVIGAARMTMLDGNLNVIVTPGPGSFSESMSESWVDPVIGVRVLAPFAEQWTAVGYADIGGFGVGSDLTYQLLAGVNWQFSRSVNAKFGYRYLYQDFEHNGFIWDMAAKGFYLGAGFLF